MAPECITQLLREKRRVVSGGRQARAPGTAAPTPSQSEVVGLVAAACRPTHHLSDHVGSKAPPGQKPHLTQPLFPAGGSLAETLLPDLTRTLQLRRLERLDGRTQLFSWQLMGAQLVLDAGGTEPPRAPPNQAIDKALVRKQLFRNKPVEHFLERLGIGRVRDEPGPKLGPAVLAPRKKPQRPSL